ncbi:MAG: PHP domain-containing protein [Gammaproteobacteria bacterium]|nr:PHP domain-containing protein [Gammaproteobacteria bacterium]
MPHYDLHSHSTHSDGTLTPTELVHLARAAGVDVLALTDHDSTDGIPEAQAAARDVGLQLVAGVEVSVSWGTQTVHVVGLNVDTGESTLQAGLRGQCEFRRQRAEEIARRLEKHGVADAYQGARAQARGAIVGRTHFARFLVEQGHAKNMRQVFKKFLVQGRPGYVPGAWADLAQAVAWIRAAGGQAVIAHPARYKLGSTRLHKLLAEFKACGGAGLEVVSGSHSRDDFFRFAHLTNRFELLASAGSDYHGPEQPWIDLGRLPPLPDGCQPIWRDWSPARPSLRSVAR